MTGWFVIAIRRYENIGFAHDGTPEVNQPVTNYRLILDSLAAMPDTGRYASKAFGRFYKHGPETIRTSDLVLIRRP